MVLFADVEEFRYMLPLVHFLQHSQAAAVHERNHHPLLKVGRTKLEVMMCRGSFRISDSRDVRARRRSIEQVIERGAAATRRLFNMASPGMRSQSRRVASHCQFSVLLLRESSAACSLCR
jgi:hypothetical protein